MQFQVGIYYEKFQLGQIKNGRPAATSDRQIFLLTRITQIKLCITPKFIPYVHFTNSSDDFEIGQDLARNQVTAAKMATFDFNMRNYWKTVPDSYTITIEQNVQFLYCC